MLGIPNVDRVGNLVARMGHELSADHELPTTIFAESIAHAAGPHLANGTFEMPVVWTKMHGKGRVFYSSVGHDAKVVSDEPHLTIMRRGFKWAAAGKALSRG